MKIHPLTSTLQVRVSPTDPAELYGLDPARAPHTDPYTRLALEALWVLTPDTVLDQAQQQGRDLLEILDAQGQHQAYARPVQPGQQALNAAMDLLSRYLIREVAGTDWRREAQVVFLQLPAARASSWARN